MKYFLCVLAAAISFFATGASAKEKICTKYPNGVYQFLDYIAYENGISPLNVKEGFEKGLFVVCPDGKSSEEPPLFALSYIEHGPSVLGSPCTENPIVVFRSWAARAGRMVNNFRFFLDTPLAKGGSVPFDLIASLDIAGLSDWQLNYDWLEKMSSFEQWSMLILRLLERQCGKMPSEITFVFAYGENKSEALSDPETMIIHGRPMAEGWAFEFPDLSELSAMHRSARIKADEEFEERTRPKSASELADERNEALLRTAQGLLLSLAGNRSGGYFDVCNRGNRRLRLSFISLVPSSDPIVFIEGFQLANSGECARISTKVHPMSVYGVAVEQELSDGHFVPFIGSIQEPNSEAIPHRFTHICAPNEGTFVRKDSGMITGNACRTGDIKLPISFNVRVGHTDFTMNVNH